MKRALPVVRRVEKSDSSRIVELSSQLGYACSLNDLLKNLQFVLNQQNHFFYVAESEDGVIGFIHAMPRQLIFYNKTAEIASLVVDEKYRNQGIGKLLLQTVEQLISDSGFEKIILSSNIIRDKAHAFYLQNGYECCKVQKVFQKTV